MVAAWRIPWHPVPGGTPAAGRRPTTCSRRAQIARANAYTDPARYLGWASLAVSLVVALVLGFTPLGARLVGAAARLVVGAGAARRRWRWPSSAGW